MSRSDVLERGLRDEVAGERSGSSNKNKKQYIINTIKFQYNILSRPKVAEVPSLESRRFLEDMFPETG